MKPQSFKLPELIKVKLSGESTQSLGNQIIDHITYYSDCVFKPYVHNIGPQHFTYNPQLGQITVDMSFLEQCITKIPKILDNIGIIRMDSGSKMVVRVGVLVTKQKDKIFISIID